MLKEEIENSLLADSQRSFHGAAQYTVESDEKELKERAGGNTIWLKKS